MRFLSLLVSLAIIGLAAYVYLNSGSMSTDNTEHSQTTAKKHIDKARQVNHQILKSTEQRSKQLEDMSR